jgi:hypothetical protein
MRVFNIVLVALAVLCASLSVKPSSTAQTKTETPDAPIYGAVHVVVPPGEKTFPAELMPAP